MLLPFKQKIWIAWRFSQVEDFACTALSALEDTYVDCEDGREIQSKVLVGFVPEDVIRIVLLTMIAVFLLSLFIAVKTGHDKAPRDDEIQIPDVTSMTMNQAMKTMDDDGIDRDTVALMVVRE